MGDVKVYLNGRRFGLISRERCEQLQSLGVLGRVDSAGFHLTLDEISSGLQRLNSRLADAGALLGWRDEFIDVLDWSGALHLGSMERAAARFWGSYTRAVHLNGWVAGGRGAPAQVWLALRADHKATDPGLWDNLVAGGLGLGEGVSDALKREAFEEAGLKLEEALECLSAPPLLINRAVDQGWQRELLMVFDVCLLPQWHPQNQDGEVQAFECMTCVEAAKRAAGGSMCADAALVTQAFLRRRGMPGVEAADPRTAGG